MTDKESGLFVTEGGVYWDGIAKDHVIPPLAERYASVGEYARKRYGKPHMPTDRTVLAARLSHMHWIAVRLHEAATTLLTQAQLREEEAIERLVFVKNACEPTAEAAREVLAAAELVEQLEERVETLAMILDENNPGVVEGPCSVPNAPDLTYPSDAAGVDEDDPKVGDCDA